MFTRVPNDEAYYDLTQDRGFIAISSNFYVKSSYDVLSWVGGRADYIYPLLYRIKKPGRFYVSRKHILPDEADVGFIIY